MLHSFPLFSCFGSRGLKESHCFFSLSPWGFESEIKELVFDDIRMWVYMVLSSG